MAVQWWDRVMRCSDMFGKCSEIVGTDPDEMDRSAAAGALGGGARGLAMDDAAIWAAAEQQRAQ